MGRTCWEMVGGPGEQGRASRMGATVNALNREDWFPELRRERVGVESRKARIGLKRNTDEQVVPLRRPR